MLYSYAMGVDKSIYELEKQGFKIEEDDGDYMVSFPESKSEIWENFIKSKLQVEFWNEYMSRDTMEIVFNFHLKEGFKRYVVKDLNKNRRKLFVSKEDVIETEGVIVETLPNAMFKVKLSNGHIITAHISGKLRQHYIKIIIGDSVKLEMSPYDLTKGRITWRSKS